MTIQIRRRDPRPGETAKTDSRFFVYEVLIDGATRFLGSKRKADEFVFHWPFAEEAASRLLEANRATSTAAP